MKPSIGRIVHFHFEYCGEPAVAPAVITAVWSDDCVNLQVFPDGSNAYDYSRTDDANAFKKEECDRGVAWRTSISQGEPADACTWGWPPRV